ncbi:unnamed protein product [Agarophyton chilense]
MIHAAQISLHTIVGSQRATDVSKGSRSEPQFAVLSELTSSNMEINMDCKAKRIRILLTTMSDPSPESYVLAIFYFYVLKWVVLRANASRGPLEQFLLCNALERSKKGIQRTIAVKWFEIGSVSPNCCCVPP